MKKVKFGDIQRALRGKGFAIALCLSVAAVGVSTYIAYNQAVNRIGGIPDVENSIAPYFGNDAPVNRPQSGVPETELVPPDIEFVTPGNTDNTEDETETGDFLNDPAEEANNPLRSRAPVVMPVEGEVGNPFSNGELVKSKTLGVWKTHDGIDIVAPLGTPVMAMTSGVVDEVYSDPLWGICVVIDHGDGIIASYFGLDKNVTVSVGQEVGSGDVIGAVGDTAEIEIAEGPHLHFGVRKNGEWVDPMGLF
ncbi:MAG: M23 family metallopeptidase [Oscillospiraceae bacterium]|nr:M23 family metallopeptidase [Oscillospiraceae bacterium]